MRTQLRMQFLANPLSSKGHTRLLELEGVLELCVSSILLSHIFVLTHPTHCRGRENGGRGEVVVRRIINGAWTTGSTGGAGWLWKQQLRETQFQKELWISGVYYKHTIPISASGKSQRMNEKPWHWMLLELQKEIGFALCDFYSSANMKTNHLLLTGSFFECPGNYSNTCSVSDRC